MTAAVSPPATRRQGRRRVAALVVLLAAVPGGLVARHLRHDWRVRIAERAEANGDFGATRAALVPLLRAAPDDPDLNMLAARVEWRARLAEPFPAGWERAAEKLLALAQVASHLVGRASGDRDAIAALNGDRAAVGRLTKRAAAGGPDAPAYFEALARCHLDAHRPGEAVEACDRLIGLRPDHAPAHLWRALATELADRVSGEAEPDFRRAAELDPARPVYRLNLALHLLGRITQLAEARQLLEELRLETPDDPDVLRGLGSVLLLTDPAAAAPVFARLVGLRPADGEVLALFGQAQLETGQFPEAERSLRAAVAKAPGSYPANYQLFRLLTATGRAPDGEPFRLVAEKLGRDRTRMHALGSEIAARPADPAPRAELGRLHLNAGAAELGAYWLETALTADPQYEPARKALAELASKR